MITSTQISFRIWFYTSIVLLLGTVIYMLSAAENKEEIIYLVIAFFVSLVASVPVLIGLLIVIPFIHKRPYALHSKINLLVSFIATATFCYGFVPIVIRFFTSGSSSNDNYFFDILRFVLVLFSAALIATFLNIKSIVYYFSNNAITTTSYSIIFKQLFKTSKTNNMDTQHTNQNLNDQNFNRQVPPYPESENKHSNKILIKGIITGVLILVMLIPTLFIQNLINERQALQQSVVKEVSSGWAKAQTLTAPFITIPYTEQTVDINGTAGTYKKNLFVLADNLDASGTIFPEERKRSIYKVLLYRSDLKFTGNFKPVWPKDINLANVDFANAKICFGLSDAKGIEEALSINFNNEKLLLNPGMQIKEMGEAIVSAPISITEASLQAGLAFDIKLKIKGSEQLHFLPLSANSKFNINSTWGSPSFDGNTLPNSHSVKDSGFAAQWAYNSSNLPFGTIVKDGNLKLSETAFGVSLVQPADQYSKTTRSVKYAILLIGLSFALFFIIELMQKNPLHPVQYVLVGLALVIFYTLLLSIGEYIVFDLAYLTAATATITLITLYAKSHFDSWKSALVFATLLSCLYAFVFILIRLEDAALLVGSIGLFIILAMVMYGSRKISWYNK